MTMYDKGRRLEYDARKSLLADGYWLIRAAGSKGKVDLIAIKAGQIVFIQAKADNDCPPAERTELLRIAGLIDGLAVIAYRDRGIKFRRLLGHGPADWEPWTPDEITPSAKEATA